MRYTSMYLTAGIAFTLIFASCGSQQSARENRRETVNQLEEQTGDLQEEVNEAYTTTKQEISDETAELKNEAKQLKEQIQENQLEPADSAINRYLAEIDEGIQDLEVKAREFQAAAEQRREQIKVEIDRLEKDVASRLDRLADELEEG